MSPLSRLLLLFSAIFIVLGVLLVYESSKEGDLRMVFCDIGQGDGFLIVSPGGKQVVIDGGPGTKIVDCLSQSMPFWDRKIELMVLTHPQKDHMEGLIEVLNRYKVEAIMTTDVSNNTEVYDVWKKAVNDERANVHEPKSDDTVLVDKNGLLKLEVLWPGETMLKGWQNNPPSDLNDSSVTMRVSFGKFCAYLTGDLPKEILSTLIDKSCQVLKVSHHGSKTGTSEEILEKAQPEYAIIQVGKNRFGHPHQEVLDILESKNVQTYRNDIDGEIQINSNGGAYSVYSKD
jgi:competence protein ComEC